MLNMRVAWILLLFQLSCFALEPAPPLNIARITLSDAITLENQTKALGLQDAINSKYKSPNGAITVFPDACIQRDGTPDCTAACQDKTQMFSNLKTLHNCAVFPHISVQLANNNLTVDARRVAEELKIEPSNDGSSLPSDVSNAIQSCLLDSCKNNENCAGTLDGPKLNHSPNKLTGTRFIDNTYFTLCDPIPAYVNADVGGIGVMITSLRFFPPLLTISLGIYFLRYADGASLARVPRHRTMGVNLQRIPYQLLLLSRRSIATACL